MGLATLPVKNDFERTGCYYGARMREGVAMLMLGAVSLLVSSLGLTENNGASASMPDDEAWSWLVGCWETKGGKTREVWQQGAKSHLFGFNLVLRDGDVVFFEQLRLQETSRGWVYFASPRGAKEVAFDVRTSHSLAFEVVNEEHDFPQRISYQIIDGALHAEASLIDGGNAQRWVYTPCQDE